MKPYICRIYNFNYSLEIAEKSEWSRMYKPSVAQTVMYGRTARHAAAKAYVAECGLLRASILQSLGCPIAVIQFETSTRRVWRAMKRCMTWSGRSFFFDNGAEIYYVTSSELHDYLRNQRNLQATAYSKN